MAIIASKLQSQANETENKMKNPVKRMAGADFSC